MPQRSHQTSINIKNNNLTSSAFLTESSSWTDLLSTYSSILEKWMLHDLRCRNVFIYFQSLDGWMGSTMMPEEEGRHKRTLFDIQILKELKVQNLVAMCNPVSESLKHQQRISARWRWKYQIAIWDYEWFGLPKFSAFFFKHCPIDQMFSFELPCVIAAQDLAAVPLRTLP